MNLFGLGPLEVLVIAVLSLVIFGPEKLPIYIRRGLDAYRQVRALGTEWREQVEREIGGDLRELSRDMNEGLEAFGRSIEGQLRDVDDEIRSAQQAITEPLASESAIPTPSESLPLIEPVEPNLDGDEDDRPVSLDYRPN